MTLALVRKGRLLVWAAVGLALMARRGLSVRRLASDASRAVSRRMVLRSQRAPHILGKVATILVVDDEPAIRTLVGRVLERQGHQVVLCRDRSRPWPTTAPVDLLLVDHMLPGMTGLEITEQLRRALAEAARGVDVRLSAPARDDAGPAVGISSEADAAGGGGERDRDAVARRRGLRRSATARRTGIAAGRLASRRSQLPAAFHGLRHRELVGVVDVGADGHAHRDA